VPAPHRPWLPPLPDRVLRRQLATGPGRRVALGLVDRPDVQAQEVLALDLDDGGTWLVVGGPRSGRTTLLRTVLDGAVAGCTPAGLHVHVLDHGGGALSRTAAALPHAGTCLDGDDRLRTVRLVARLAEEVAARRSGLSSGSPPRLLLLVDGAESVLDQLDDSDPTGGSTGFLRLLREGAAVGLTCVLTADRAVPGGRLAAAATERLVLPLADRADYAVAGVSAAAVPAVRPPGRALVGDRALECQLALPDEPPGGAARAGECPPGVEPLRIVELESDPVLADEVPAGPLHVAIGPGGDDGRTVRVDLGRTGGLLVIGPPHSGRSSLLRALSADLLRRGTPVLRVGRAPAVGSHDGEPGAPWVGPRDVEAAAEWLARTGGPAVVVADDVGAAADWPVLAALASTGAAPPALVAAGAAGELTGHYQGVVAALRRSRSGLLLCPGAAEADVLGARLPRIALPVRPGSGWLVSGGRLERVQVARRRPAGGER
jgi:S-DNA-T family DNA segregation ATPase FtsK/SpoIIIE